jgi:hypothetical protein
MQNLTEHEMRCLFPTGKSCPANIAHNKGNRNHSLTIARLPVFLKKLPKVAVVLR